MATVEQLEERLREVAQTQARIMIDVEMYRGEIKALKERVAALENRAGTASQLAPAPVVVTPPAASVPVDRYGYRVWPEDPLRGFMAGDSSVARAIAKHKFDITIGNRVVTPLDTDYGAAYHMSGKFAGVARDLQKAWLTAILLDAGVNPMPPWFLAEFGAP